MNSGWQTACLGDVLAVLKNGLNCKQDKSGQGQRISRIESISLASFDLGRVGYAEISDQDKSKFRLSKGDILFSHINSPIHVGKTAVFDIDDEVFHGVNLLLMRPTPAVSAAYLELYLKYLFEQGYWLSVCKQSVNQASVNQQDISRVLIAYPAELAEQCRIVAILDEAFEGIATAKASAEKNLQNARELFESHLDSELNRHADGYVATALGAEVDLLAGYAFSSGSYSDAEADVRLLRGDNIMQGYLRWEEAKRWPASDCAAYARFALREGDVVLAMDRPWVKAGLKRAQISGEDLPCLQVQRTARLRPRQTLREDFLFHLTGSRSFSRHLLEVQTGIGVPHISGKQIESFRFMRPPLNEQASIAGRLSALYESTQQLADISQRKLIALDELKKSLLHQAFTGQLTAAKQARVVLQSVLPTTTPEFAANVIALAQVRHERQRREKTFGHVKEQKLLHLVESIGKIDLGRQPMRDAAGPNDFQHMLKAEEWAKAHHFFETVKRGEGYEFRKLSAFDEYLSKARRALGPYLQPLERVIDLLVPMDTKEAEVFATVHAAWNNLLIDGAEVTDDVIISAAREGWHPDKLEIPVHKFQRAIELIRQQGLVPDGTAKYVGGQQRLL